MSQQDIGYKESLMLFIRDLGPTAQMIAKRKLHGLSTANFQISDSNPWFQTPKCQDPPAVILAQQRPPPLDTTFNSSMSQNISYHHQGHRNFPGNSSDRFPLCDIGKGGKVCTGDKWGTHFPSVEVEPKTDGRKVPSAFGGIMCTSSAVNVVGVLGSDKAHKGESTGIKLSLNSSMAAARDSNFSVSGLKDTGDKSTSISDKNKLANQAQSSDSAMEYSPLDMFRFNLVNNSGSASLLGPQQSTSMSISCQTKTSLTNLGSQCLRDDGAIAAQGQDLDEMDSQETSQSIKSSQPLPLVSQFTFDLPYLKTRLDQINTSSRQDRLLHQQCSGTGGSIMEKMSYQRVDNHHHSSLDPKHTDLVLQL